MVQTGEFGQTDPTKWTTSLQSIIKKNMTEGHVTRGFSMERPVDFIQCHEN